MFSCMYMHKTQHHHLSPLVVEKQVAYSKSHGGFESARAIVQCKLRNCRLLLSGFLQSRARAGYANAELLRMYQTQIQIVEHTTEEAKDHPSLFRLEAQASRAYWKAIALICHQDLLWQRVYPHARGSLNILLNTGYTGLARRVMEKIEEVGLMPEFGLLHGASSGDALVYDIMECFRQSTVDGAIIPLFSRKKTSLTEKGMKHGFWQLSTRLDKYYPYEGKCEKLDRIVFLEVMRLKKCTIENIIWTPYTHRWGHSWRC